jgi:hypothetical protein
MVLLRRLTLLSLVVALLLSPPEIGTVSGQAGEAQWKTLRTTNTIERLHEEFRRRVKTQGSLPSEDAAVVLLFSAAVLRQHTTVAA